MIHLYIGNLGSGKTLSCVRDLFINDRDIVTYSNIRTVGIVNNVLIKTENILKRHLVRTTRQGEEIYKYEFNKEFWQKLREKHECLDIILDEAHRLYDSRKGMSNINTCLNHMIALLRRLVGEADSMKGTLVLITQLPDAIDKRARQMCSLVKYHRMEFSKKCKDCSYIFYENSETVIRRYRCPNCNAKKLEVIDYNCYVWIFASVHMFELWFYNGYRTWEKGGRYILKHCQKWFNKYNSEQWDDLTSQY